MRRQHLLPDPVRHPRLHLARRGDQAMPVGPNKPTLGVGAVTAVRSILLVILAAIAEIGGGCRSGRVREHKGWVWVGAGVIALGRYGGVATLQPDAASVAGRWSRPGTTARAPGDPGSTVAG
ncbi:MAG: hypothetical protein ACR2I1_00415 [Propionibacteriaceae bacterium]